MTAKKSDNVLIAEKTFNDAKVGKVRATVVSVKKDIGQPDKADSKAIVNPWENTSADDIIPPPFEPLSLSMMGEQTGLLAQCIEVMNTNVAGFGFRLKPYADVNLYGSDSDDEGLGADVQAEYEAFHEFIEYCDYQGEAFTDLYGRTVTDREYTGNAYWEVVRDDEGGISAFNHLPSYTMRLRKKIRDAVEVDQHRPAGRGRERSVKRVRIRRHFRTFVQASVAYQPGERNLVYFKEYGDPRDFWASNGEMVTDREREEFESTHGNPIPRELLANEVIHWRLYCARSPYGIPRYIGVLLSVLGSRAVGEINYTTFLNNNIPSMVLLISGGMLSEESVDRLQQFVTNTIQGQDNYSKFLVLEAEGFEVDSGDPGQVKMDMKPMTREQHTDALFQQYDENNRKRIREAFRIPPILLGGVEDYNRATGETTRRLADEQVFDPVRRSDAGKINRVLRDMGMRFHRFELNVPNITDHQSLIEVLKGAERSGGVTPRIARMIMENILGEELGRPPTGVDMDRPFTLTVAEAVKNRGDAQGQITSFKTEEKSSLADEIIQAAQRQKRPPAVLNCGSQAFSVVEGAAKAFVTSAAIGLKGRSMFVSDGHNVVGQAKFGRSRRVTLSAAAQVSGVSEGDLALLFPDAREVWITEVVDRSKMDSPEPYEHPADSMFASLPESLMAESQG